MSSAIGDPLRLGVFVVWAAGRAHERQILDVLRSDFEVLGVDEVHWSPDRVAENYSRFYRVSGLPPFRSSLPHYKGRGPFLVIVVRDENPLLGERMTMGGVRVVSTRIVDAKARFRDLTGGGVKVHSSDTPADAIRDLMLLLGITPEEYLAEHADGWDGTIRSLHRDVVGSDGWDDLEQMFGVLAAMAEYVVLDRSDERVQILTSRYRWTLAVTRARPRHRFPPRWGGSFLVPVGGSDMEVVLRFVGDGYLDTNWATDLIARRREAEDGSFVPSEEDDRVLSAYRSVVHGGSLGGDATAEVDAQWAAVRSFLDSHGYEVTEPRDPAVPFRPPGQRGQFAVRRSVMAVGARLGETLADPVRFRLLSGREWVLAEAPWLRRFAG